MEIMIDSDSFFWPSDISDEYMKEERKCISFEKYDCYSKDMLEQYYLGFRSSWFFCEDTITEDNEKIDETLETYRKMCLNMALDYMMNNMNSEKSLPVDYLWIIRNLVVNALKDKYPDIEKIEIKLSMQPRFSARTVDKNTIVIPALLRSVLIQCNLAIMNSIYDYTDGFNQSKIDTIRNSISIDGLKCNIDQTVYNARFIFPYLLYCHDNLSVMHLPFIGARSKDVVTYALNFTNIQLAFIIMHEYAHILLNHFNDNRERVAKENEADSFAIDILLEYLEKQYSKEDLLLSIRWLFKYQLLEEKMGKLVQGESVTSFESHYQDRRVKCQYELLTKFGEGGCSVFETIGFGMIVDLQRIIYKMGIEVINDIFEAFNKAKKTKEVEPWWKKIEQE